MHTKLSVAAMCLFAQLVFAQPQITVPSRPVPRPPQPQPNWGEVINNGMGQSLENLQRQQWVAQQEAERQRWIQVQRQQAEFLGQQNQQRLLHEQRQRELQQYQRQLGTANSTPSIANNAPWLSTQQDHQRYIDRRNDLDQRANREAQQRGMQPIPPGNYPPSQGPRNCWDGWKAVPC